MTEAHEMYLVFPDGGVASFRSYAAPRSGELMEVGRQTFIVGRVSWELDETEEGEQSLRIVVNLEFTS